MKKSFILCMAALMLASCAKDVIYDETDVNEVETEVSGQKKSFTFTVKGEFEAATFNAPAKHPSMRRATSYLTDNGNEMTDLWVYDYMGGTLIQTVHQTADDTEWGKPKMSLAYGEHHIYFVASRGADPVVNQEEHIISWGTVRDTFWKDYVVNVVSTSNGNRAVTLDRVATKLRIVIDDEVPAACASISLTPDKWYYGLDYVTGDAVTAKRQPITVNVPESYVGTIGEIAVSVFGLSGVNEWTTNVSVNAADLGGITIGSAQIIGAPFKRNRATEYHGALFGAAGSMVVSVNNDWDDSVTGTW